MADGEVVIVDKDGIEHVFPSGFDPIKAAGIVRNIPLTEANAKPLSSPSTYDEGVRAWWKTEHPQARQLVRGALDTLPVAGAMVAGTLAGPETLGAGTIPAAAVGAGIGRGGRDLIAEWLGVDDPTSPLSKAGRIALDTTITAAAPVVASRVKDILANPKASLADVIETMAHPTKTGKATLDTVVDYLRSSAKPLPMAPPQSFNPLAQMGSEAPLTAEQLAAQGGSGHAVPTFQPPSLSGPSGVPASAMGPDASARAATMRAAAAPQLDPVKDLAVLKTLVGNGVPPGVAAKQIAGANPARFGALMTAYLKERVR